MTTVSPTLLTFRAWVVVADKTADPEGDVISRIAHSIATGSRDRPGPIKSASDLRQYLIETGADRQAVAAARAVWARYQAAQT